MKSVQEESTSFGMSRILRSNKKQLLSINFKAIHLKCPRVEFGIFNYKNDKPNKSKLCISLFFERQSTTITFYEDISERVYAERTLPHVPAALPEFGMEVNRASRTIRFLLCGEQVHDGDIAIPWTAADLDTMAFTVWLFEPGDCVRIID